MDIARCFEILELDPNATPEELRQAYKDMANVWHPDRFPGNPRLRKKAEEKLKEANLAYETLSSYLSSKQQERAEGKTSRAQTRAGGQTTARPTKEAGYNDDKAESIEPETLENIVRVGTIGVLTLWSHLSCAVRRMLENVKAEMEQEDLNRDSGKDANRTARPTSRRTNTKD